MSSLTLSRKKIHTLSPYLASQIAAGEVVERPLSVVKELVENSLDAHSTQIEIIIEEGGLQRIQIRDNGMGIPKEELSLALQHHATSKIDHAEDIEHLSTLGFRGEALASISAVSRICLTSHSSEDQHGWQIVQLPGKPASLPKPIAHPSGTTVEISELFHHLPARRRFLRSPTTEFGRIYTLVKSLSLSHWKTNFILYHNKKQILNLPVIQHASCQAQRMTAVFGTAFSEACIAVNHEQGTLKLSGWISAPHHCPRQSDLQYFYVNQRLIRDKLFYQAIKQAYQDVLYQGRRPAVILFLQIDFAEVDINVHPTKSEVRFRQPHVIYEFIKKSIQKTLAQGQWSSMNQSTHYTDHSVPSFHSIKEPKKAEPIPFQKRILEPQHHIQRPQEFTVAHPISTTIQNIPSPKQTVIHCHTEQALGYALAQLHTTYILSENEAGLMIVDTHAAHERILYEKLKKNLKQKKLANQPLLVPISLDLQAEEIALIKENHSLLSQLGLDYQLNASNKIEIQAIPYLLNATSVAALLRDLLHDLNTESHTNNRLEETQHKLLGTLACRAAIQVNRKMSTIEMNELLRLMEKTNYSGHCNHGRPTWYQITMKELDRWFLRGR